MPVIGTVGPARRRTRIADAARHAAAVDQAAGVARRSSYSWYLWHWPLIVFARTVFAGSRHALFVAAAVSLVPAMLSFRFVEEPIRRARVWPSTKAGVGIAAISVTTPLVYAMAFTTAVDRGWGDAKIARIREAAAPSHIDASTSCAALAPLGDPSRPLCVWKAASARGTVLLIGDSNAGHFSEPFIAAAHSLNYEAKLAMFGGCPFVRRPTYQSESCREFVEGSLSAIARRRAAYAAIVISNGTMRYLNRPSASVFVADALPQAPLTRPAEVANWVAILTRALETIGSRSPIVVVGAVPQFNDLPQ